MQHTMNEFTPTTASSHGQATGPVGRGSASGRPDPQVVIRPTRRRFTAEYKRRILQEADACRHPGEMGELLRREGLYSSSITKFRQQLAAGRLSDTVCAKDPQHRNLSEAARQRDSRRIARLEAENAKLRALLELQKKLSDLIGLPLLTESAE